MNNFDTVREALHVASHIGPNSSIPYSEGLAKQALTALAAIEADHFTPGDMADAQAKAFRAGVASVTAGQEPVAWQRRMKPVWGARDYLWSPWEECSEGTAEDCWKTPLLHEWAYEARALYTAVPVDQRPRAKEIGEADLDPDEGDPVTLWAEIWRLREAVKGPDGYATWQDAATAERIRRVRAESKHAAPVAQQHVPEADCGNIKAQQQRDDAVGIVCYISKNRAVVDWYGEPPAPDTKLYTAPQQAEAVPLTHVLVPVDEPTDEMVDAACAAVDGMYRVDFVRAYVAAFAHLKAGYRDESYWCGWNAAIKSQQAEAVPPDVVRDAERYRFIRDNCNRRINIEIDNAGIEISDTVDAAIDAAMAQGEKP